MLYSSALFESVVVSCLVPGHFSCFPCMPAARAIGVLRASHVLPGLLYGCVWAVPEGYVLFPDHMWFVPVIVACNGFFVA